MVTAGGQWWWGTTGNRRTPSVPVGDQRKPAIFSARSPSCESSEDGNYRSVTYY
jgi:hypothetical protein